MISDEALQKRMEYMQDVAGWKSIIFLPFQFVWQCVMMISVIYVFVTSISRVTYHIEGRLEMTTGYFCDCLYFTDTICSILHHSLTDTRKLKNYKTRPWILILIDSFSLFPFELIYIAVYITQEKHSHQIWYYLFLNRTLRIYRIYYYFNEYEMSVNSLKLGIFYTAIPLNIYGICLTHIATAIYHQVKSEEELIDLPKSPIKYIFLEEVKMYFLMSHRFIGDQSSYDTTPKRICFIIFMVIGHFYFYGITLPKIMFAYQKRHRNFFDFWNRFKRLTMFINNAIENEALEKKVLNMFQTVWTYGKGDFEPELLQSYPTNMRKNAYADMYWDVLRHSELLQNVSRSCKRSLALRIIGDFYVPNTIFWDTEENKNIIVYLASGIIQIMAEENKESPIMSFSAGTVLGESSIFYPERSKAILRVATFSEIHILRAKDFFRVIKDYPKDQKIVRYNLKLRLRIARMTQIRKKVINKVIFTRNAGALEYTSKDELDSVKWIKTQFRQIAVMEETQSKFGKDSYVAEKLLNRQLNQLKTGIDHTSIYLPLLSLGEDIEVITDQTCLKTTIPWVMDPNSPFTRHWRYLMLCFTMFCSLTYPVFIAWWPKVPPWLISLSALISMFYLCDIFIQISTAIKTKDEFIAKSGPIFRYRLKRLSFYADFISALPYQIIFQYLWLRDGVEDKLMRISIAISLLKIYRLVGFLDDWCQTLKGRFSVRVMFKHLLYTFILTYWCAAFLHFCDVRCLFWSCEGGSWYRSNLEGAYPQYRDLASTFYTITYLLGVSSVYGYTQTFPTAVFVIVTFLAIQFNWLAWFGEFTGSYMSESSQKIEFKNLLQSINSFMTDRKIVGRVMKRVWDTMQFQWIYDCGDNLTQQRAMLEDVPFNLETEVNRSTIFEVLKKCDAFQSEGDTFIWYLCRRSRRLALPAGSIIVTYGTQTMSMYVVYKGYLQVNSFLPKDIVHGVAAPALYGPGKIVPILIALNQMPSVVTARALTDCELISIPLETMLSGLVLNDSFKDFVQAIKELDLQPFRQSKLVFSRVSNITGRRDAHYREPFARISYFGWLVRCLLAGPSINGGGKRYIRWEMFRLLTIIVSATVWPFAFVLPHCRGHLYLVYTLLGLESFTWFDFFIKMHVAYYNSKGIYISHPVSTSSHYISTSLILEIFVFLPYLHSVYIIATDPDFNVASLTVVCHCLVRIFSLYRVFLFATNYSEMDANAVSKSLGFIVIIFIGLNCFIVLKIWSEIQWTCHANGTTTHTLAADSWIRAVEIQDVDTLGEMYLIMFYAVVMLVYRGDAFFKDFTTGILISEIVLTIFGVIISLLSMALILSRTTGSKMNFIVYQYHIKSLTNFLKAEKAEDAISQEVINHFEHEWEKKKGEDLHTVFTRFPNILHEDLIYPVYRKMFLRVPCFKNANDGFFRNLSRTFIEVHFRKWSVISFEKAVHSDIFFVMNGWCSVNEDSAILGQGSVMGDIKGRGVMTNNIRAKTHVVLLAITSRTFFGILNNFSETEAAFFDAVKDVDDYVKSDYEPPVEADLQQAAEWTDRRNVESEFELAEKKDLKPAFADKKTKVKIKLAKYINPNSRLAKVLLTVFVMDAIATALVIPMIMALQIRNFTTTVLVHFLDAIWFIKIVSSFRTAYISPETGNLVTNVNMMCKNYLKSFDGFFVDVLCILPLEYIFIITKYHTNWDWFVEKYGYSARLLRLLSLWIRMQKEKRKLSLRDRTRWSIIIMREIIVYNILTAVNLIIATDDRFRIKAERVQYTSDLMEAIIWSFLDMFNVYAATGLDIVRPASFLQLTFHIFVAVYALFERTLLTSEALAIINGSLFVKSEKLYKMQLMEKFLAVRDISPALGKNLMKYACDLLLHFKGEVNPWFLKTAPYYIRVQITQDLYLNYLHGCHAFRGMPHDFLKQLPARFQRHVFFPSDVITEKGDVDFCMYFVHNGEVVSIESDPIYHGLDYETGQFMAGDFFGLEQGLEPGVPQSTTYRALTKVDLLILNYYEWEDLRLAFPEVVGILKRNMVVQTTPN